MKKSPLLSVLFVLCAFASLSQDNRTTSMYLGIEHDLLLTSPTRLVNPSLTGVNFEMYFNRKRRFQPIVNLSSLVQLQTGHFNQDAVDRHGSYINPVGNVFNAFTGVGFLPSRRLLISVVGGPVFLDKETLLGFKPAIGIYLGKFRRFAARLSYMQVSRSRLNPDQHLQALGASFTVRLY